MRANSIFAVLLAITLSTIAQAQSATGSISGTVTIHGKPARGVKVVALMGELYDSKVMSVAVTDAAGRYELKTIPPGVYRIAVSAPAFSTNGAKIDFEGPGRSVTLAQGEEIENIDFDITPGGVITGRVFEANGRQIIDEKVFVSLAPEDKDEVNSRHVRLMH